MTPLQTLNRDKMNGERYAMELRLFAEMQEEKEPHLLAIRNARIAIEQITDAYYALMKAERDRIQQSNGFPGVLWRKQP